MREFKEIIKKKGIKKTLLYLILTILMFSPLFIFRKQVVGTFKGTCVATNYNELKKCQEEGRFTTIKTVNIYDVGYNYVVDNKTVGKFLDVDLDGYVILTLADTATADELLNQVGEREISGNFSTFKNKVFQETKEKVEKDYIERFANEAEIITEEETRGMFFNYMLNQYDGEGFPFIFVIILVGVIILLLLFKVFEGLKMIISPNKCIIYGRKTLEKEGNADKASFEYRNGPYLFKNKNIRITNNYIFDTRGYNFMYHKVNEAVWMYEKGIKRYGIIETGKNLVVKFKDKVGMSLPLNLAERKKVMEIFRVKNKNIVKGYSAEREAQYRKNPSSLK